MTERDNIPRINRYIQSLAIQRCDLNLSLFPSGTLHLKWRCILPVPPTIIDHSSRRCVTNVPRVLRGYLSYTTPCFDRFLFSLGPVIRSQPVCTTKHHHPSTRLPSVPFPGIVWFLQPIVPRFLFVPSSTRMGSCCGENGAQENTWSWKIADK